jgi:DNA end-binding protein Ku
MAGPTWRGAISFGMVSVPVRLFTAVRSRDIRFRQLHRDTKRPVRQKRVDPETGEEVAYGDIVKGYEVGDARYVVVDPDELEELDPSASRNIEIHDFVEQEEIDPIHYDRAYYLAPDGETAAKPYTLLAQALGRTDKVAIAQFVMRNKEYLAAIRSHDGRLVMSTMHYSDEVTDPAEVAPDAFAVEVDVRPRELEMAEQLIASMTTGFCPTCYRNEHRERVLEYLEAKAAGDQIEVPSEDRDRGEVIDLMSALERSLDRARAGQGNDAGGTSDDPTSAGDTTPEYEAMTRAELYELAQERDLAGRSGMTKAQLAAALRELDAEAGAA